MDEWEYRGEGNASLVIASKKEGIVYRVLKRKVNKNSQDGHHEKEKSKEHFENVMKYKVGYITHVMKPLLCEEYVSPWKLVAVSKDFLQQVSDKFQSFRPQARLSTEVNTLCSHVVQLPDFCLLPGVQNDNVPTFCIEIKPKAGFLPTSEFISEDHQIKKSVCRFCMHQRLKLKEGKWSCLSEYCPIDLFSGKRSQMKKALSALFSNPQNNLRIFKNGALLYGATSKHPPTKDVQLQLINQLVSWYGQCSDDDHDVSIATSPAIHSLQDVIIKALLSSSQNYTVLSSSQNDTVQSSSQNDTVLSSAQNDTVLSSSQNDTVLSSSQNDTVLEPIRKKRKLSDKSPQRCTEDNLDVGILPEGCVLDNLLKVQKLDSLDIEGIYPLFVKLQQHFEDHPTDRKSWKLDGPYIEAFLTEEINSIPVSLQENVRKIKEYLVAMTTKDCSIMLALQPIKENQASTVAFVEDEFHNKFHYKIQLADLDPKLFDNILKYYQLDKEIVENYMKEVEIS